MYFYEVWVRSNRYRKNTPLTYSADVDIGPGGIVMVPMQSQSIPGVVVRQVKKPPFACKPVSAVYEHSPLGKEALGLMDWFQTYYPAPIGALTQLFLPSHLPVGPTEATGSTLSERRLPKIVLNPAQQQAVAAMPTAGTYILHGRTGSGKTRVYAALAQESLRQGKSVLILSPEISLAPQLAAELTKYLGSVITIHSKMTTKERGEAWLHILDAHKPVVVIGPRSALFSPFRKLGLIVLDESHEPSYKQEQQPYYYAPRVAGKLADLHGAKLVLGSATPTISDYYIASQKKRPIITLDSIATGNHTPVDRILVDLRDRSAFTRSGYLSDQLIEALRRALESGEQSMLYLNRRGTARLTLCRECGWQATCPRCDLPLAYHGDIHQSLCHVCGHRELIRSACPTCGNTDIIFKSAGTKAIADEVSRLFPEARVSRFDTDNRKAERLEQHYESILAGDVDVLVGTQLLAKGLDLPRLTTLGIVLADTSLAIPDYTAQERTYQLIRQVLGRIGRGHTKHATAVIQTYAPDSLVIQSALSEDWQHFYERELQERERYGFPPHVYLLKIASRRATSKSAEASSSKLADSLRSKYGNVVHIDGPAPAFHEKHGTKYEWQLIIKAKNRQHLTQIIADLPDAGTTYDIDPVNLL